MLPTTADFQDHFSRNRDEINNLYRTGILDAPVGKPGKPRTTSRLDIVALAFAFALYEGKLPPRRAREIIQAHLADVLSRKLNMAYFTKNSFTVVRVEAAASRELWGVVSREPFLHVINFAVINRIADDMLAKALLNERVPLKARRLAETDLVKSGENVKQDSKQPKTRARKA